VIEAICKRLVLISLLCLIGCDESARELSQADPVLESKTLMPDISATLEIRETEAEADSLVDENQQELGLLSEMPQWQGDLDGMTAQGFVRVVTTFNRTLFFLDGGRPRGAVQEWLREFEDFLNEGRTKRIKVLTIPVSRDQLLPAILDGRADLIATNLTVTNERSKQLAFSHPIATGVNEVVVTGPYWKGFRTLADLADVEVHVRASSSYAESLRAVSDSLREAGLAPIRIRFVDEHLEAEDILELVSAGTIKATVVDDFLALLWSDVLDGLVVHHKTPLAMDSSIAWAFRQNSPLLREKLNDFLDGHRQGTLLGNVIMQRYFKNNTWVRNPVATEERVLFDRYRPIFERYAERYEVDWLMSAAQGYQESRLDQDVISSVGAIGIMQLLPSTAADSNVAVEGIHIPENNIHAGIKYMSFLRKRYFSDGDLDDRNASLFTLAAYNAGPARVRRLRKAAASRGLNPNRWFQHVEHLAPRETATYVGNIVKYYLSYREHLRRNEGATFKEAESDGP
jgi:membrane-bound lytic murein transglycosylase MltF